MIFYADVMRVLIAAGAAVLIGIVTHVARKQFRSYKALPSHRALRSLSLVLLTVGIGILIAGVAVEHLTYLHRPPRILAFFTIPGYLAIAGALAVTRRYEELRHVESEEERGRRQALDEEDRVRRRAAELAEQQLKLVLEKAVLDTDRRHRRETDDDS